MVELETRFAKDHFQDVLQAEDATFAPVAREHDREALASSLKALQGNLQSHVFLQVKRGADVIPRSFGKIRDRLKEQPIDAQQPDDALLAVARIPHRQPGELLLLA